MLVTFAVLKAGMLVKDQQLIKVPAMLVTFAVSKKGTDVNE
jgi:hypothetical protein